MLVVVAAGGSDGAPATGRLRAAGAAEVRQLAVGAGRLLVYGGPFDDRNALVVADVMRVLGWPADVRPEGGGHLAAWRRHTAPTVVGDRMWVCFPWSECDRDGAELVVEIDPGRAFGTGGHPTTRLLLAELAGRLGGGESVLDVGCGSGVLAVAAARLGAADVTAVDISPVAVAATLANAARNGVGKRVSVLDTPVARLGGRFDVIVANLDAATLINEAPAVQRCLKPQGWLALSGLSPAQTSTVAAAYHEVQVVALPQDDDWCAVVATRG